MSRTVVSLRMFAFVPPPLDFPSPPSPTRKEMICCNGEMCNLGAINFGQSLTFKFYFVDIDK